MMVDYGLLPADEPPGPGLVLKRTRRRLLGDTLTNTVTPADAETVDVSEWLDQAGEDAQ